jgi:two-component system sensor histidine kinase TtrS
MLNNRAEWEFKKMRVYSALSVYYAPFLPIGSIKRAIIFVYVGLLVSFFPVPSPAQTPVRMGVLAYRDQDVRIADLKSMLDRLQSVMPEKHFHIRFYDAPHLADAVARNELDFVLTNPTQYVDLSARYGIRRLATMVLPQSVSPEQSLGSAIFTLDKRKDINSLEDLRGKRIVAVAPDAFGGYLIAARELLRYGVDLEDKDAQSLFVGLPSVRPLEALERGDADAAILRSCLMEYLHDTGQVKREVFKIVGALHPPGFPCQVSTDLYPDWPMAAMPHTSRALAKQVSIALLEQPPTSSGLIWDVPANYESVNDLYREMMLGPYRNLRDTTVQGLFKNYRVHILGFLALLGAGLLHIIRSEYLVNRRTAELAAAQNRARTLEREITHMGQLSILGEMSATLAHEMNQPLMAISTYAQGLQRRCKTQQLDCAMVSDIAQEIVTQADRADGVIHRVRSAAQKRDPVRDRRSIAQTVHGAVELIAHLLAQQVHIEVDNGLASEQAIDADHHQIQQVLINLIKNAADAMVQAGTIEPTIRVGIAPCPGGVSIAVEDCGPPVSDEVLAHFFEPFYTTKPAGLGLGLSICKSAIEAHGGRLTVERRVPGPGLVISFFLPQGHD